ncbi:carbohydrate ABC transporter permease [Arsenicicoccus dermatophilus]|uniref:carbohydrate ABC transporter permease n=1 Tax=Arsenicicoccus dermatophilus TaxID=1076331 RepID=UPI003916DEDD
MRRHRLLPILLTVVVAAYALPTVVQLSTSVKTDPDALAHPLRLLPHPPTLQAWRQALGTQDDANPVGRWALNSVGVSLVVTVGRVLLDALAGYALARLSFRGRRGVLGLLVVVMAVPGVALLIPTFLVVTYLGMYDTYAAMILPMLVDAAGILIMKQFFESVPASYAEAARLDGAGELQILWHVLLPLARPALVTVAVLAFQASWNDLSHYLAATSSVEHKTLVTGLADLTAGNLGAGTQRPLKMATALLTTVPVVAVVVASQRYLTHLDPRR